MRGSLQTQKHPPLDSREVKTTERSVYESCIVAALAVVQPEQTHRLIFVSVALGVVFAARQSLLLFCGVLLAVQVNRGSLNGRSDVS